MFEFSVVTSCSLGDFYNTFSGQVWGWAKTGIFEASAALLIQVLTVWAGVYYMYSLAQITTGKSIMWEALLSQTYAFVIASVFLAGWTLVFELVDTFLYTALWISGRIISSTTGITITDSGSYICTISTGFKDAFDKSFGFFESDLDVFSGFGLAMFSLLFIVPWFVLWLKMIKSLAEPVMTVFAVLALAGPTAVLATVPWFRRTVMIDFKMIIEAALKLILVSAMFGVAVSFLDFAFDQMPLIILENGEMSSMMDASEWVGSDAYWFALFVFMILMWTYDRVLATVNAKLETTAQQMGSTMGQIWGSI